MKTANSKSESAQIRLNRTEVDALLPGSTDRFVPIEGYQGLYLRVLPERGKNPTSYATVSQESSGSTFWGAIPP